jgi:Ca2+-binding EF-hand superfamily protein
MYKEFMSLPHYVRYKIDDTILKFDENGSGELDAEEVQKFLLDMGFEVMDEALRYFIKANDTNGDGLLQIAEIRQFVAKLYIEMEQIDLEKENREKKIKENDIVYLTQQVKHDDPDIKTLNFQAKKVTNEQVQALFKALITNSTVTVLDLSKNTTLDNTCVAEICSLITSSKSLKRLYLDGTSITDVGKIITAMKQNKHISDMTVNEDHATDEDLDLLDEILDTNEKKK